MTTPGANEARLQQLYQERDPFFGTESPVDRLTRMASAPKSSYQPGKGVVTEGDQGVVTEGDQGGQIDTSQDKSLGIRNEEPMEPMELCNNNEKKGGHRKMFVLCGDNNEN